MLGNLTKQKTLSNLFSQQHESSQKHLQCDEEVYQTISEERAVYTSIKSEWCVDL